jgi:peptidyl-prolyl cis-trans isomerase SurA
MNRVLSLLLITLALLFAASRAEAQDQKILVTVNDVPITSYDVNARINLWKLLGGNASLTRKQALDGIINDIAKIEETKKYKAEPSEKDIDERVSRLAKGMKTDGDGLKAKLKAQGISMSTLRRYLAAQIAFSRLMSGKYKEKVEVTDAEIDAKMAEVKANMNNQLAKIKADPRMQPITVFEILEINFPVDSPDLLEARAADVLQFASRFKGCGSAKSAASGIFNVKIGKKIEADGRRVPPQLKTAFQKAGVGKAIGPFRSAKGLQLWGYCGTKKISPQMPKAQMPSREQIRSALMNQKFDAIEVKYGNLFRKNLLIEYRDPAYGN